MQANIRDHSSYSHSVAEGSPRLPSRHLAAAESRFGKFQYVRTSSLLLDCCRYESHEYSASRFPEKHYSCCSTWFRLHPCPNLQGILHSHTLCPYRKSSHYQHLP